jgi:transposase/transposase-like protein
MFFQLLVYSVNKVMEFRKDIIRLWTERRLTEREISRELRVPPATVHYWVNKEGKAQSSRQGRPRCTDNVMDREFYDACRENPFLVATDLQQELAPHCSADTVRRRLREQGLKSFIPARKPFLNAEHIQKRLTFASEHSGWNEEEWSRVLFSDEKIFRSSSTGLLRVYRPTRSDRYDSRYIAPADNPGGRHTVCIWMAFGGGGGGGSLIRILHRIEQRTLNSEYYTERILPLVENSAVENDMIFMQDRSSIHKSNLTKEWLENHNIRVMHDWPPKGPDMNPVENVWAELVRLTRRDSTNRDQLWENVLSAFNGLPDTYFYNLIDSMPRRIAGVLAKEGGWTKY